MVSMPDSQIPSMTSKPRPTVRSMRTVRSKLFFQIGGDCSSGQSPISARSSGDECRLQELGCEYTSSTTKPLSPDHPTDLLELSRDLSCISEFGSDVSGELLRLASVSSNRAQSESGADGSELGFILTLSTEVLESSTLETAEPVVRSCVDILSSSAPTEVKRAAAGKLRLLAKHRSDFRELIGASGAIQSLIQLLRSADPVAQENAVTSLLNLSLEESNKTRITAAGAIKPLVYALQIGTAVSKQNAACALLNLAINEYNQIVIGVCGAIPPLVSLLMTGSTRGKKDALTTLYKLCSARQNKERAVSAGAVTPLVALVAGGDGGTAEKAMVVLNSLSTIEQGREAIVEEGGIPALIEAVEDGPHSTKDFAVLTLLQLCADSERNREVIVREGAIPPLIALLQSTTARSKQKVEILLKYLRIGEARTAHH